MVNPEKQPDSPIRGLSVNGIKLTSRYDKKHEYKTLQKMAVDMDPYLRDYVREIFVDSKACSCYCITLDYGCSDDTVQRIAQSVATTAIKCETGYNDITVKLDGNEVAYLDPLWIGDDD